MTTIDSTAQTITRNSQTWTLAQTGLPNYFRRLCRAYGDDVVSSVLTDGDYYPPMMDSGDMLGVEDACIERWTAQEPAIRPPLEAMGYSRAEAMDNA